GLAERDVAEADLDEDLEGPRDLRVVLEEQERLLGGHREHVGDALPLVADLERLGLEPVAAALLAGHGHGSQKLELDELRAAAAAGLAATARHVEREPRLAVAAHLGFGQRREEVADRR